MADKLPYQCCICNAVCRDHARSGVPAAWIPHDATIRASHGICPVCLPHELEKVSRAIQGSETMRLAS